MNVLPKHVNKIHPWYNFVLAHQQKVDKGSISQKWKLSAFQFTQLFLSFLS
jgi:hypothetical protein